MNHLSRSFPWLVLAVATAYLVLAMSPAEDAPSQFRLHEFGQLPVVDGGRTKPVDTLARTSLMIISHRQTFGDDWNEAERRVIKGQSQPAIKWLLDVMVDNRFFEQHAALKYKVFRIENDQLLKLLGLGARPLFWRYSLEEIGNKFPELGQRAEQARKLPAKERDVFDEKVMELVQHLQLYMELANLQTPYAIPPVSQSQEWQPFIQAFIEAHRSGQDNVNALSYGRMLLAYAQGKPDEFNRELDTYRQRLNDEMPELTHKAGLEVFFNHFEPFYQCTLLYVFVFLLACAGWLVFTEPLNRAAFWLAVLTLVVHTWALGTRMYLQGRPPVTNLYSAAVWIAWGCVLLGLFLEKIYRNGVGNVVAAVTGSLSMLLAHHLAGSGDTLEMMQAVLDTNFWLATHVTVVTFGYVATVVAGVIGALYVVAGVLVEEGPVQVPGTDDLRCALLRHALELHRNRPGRHLGRPIVGTLLGLGPQGERCPSHRALEHADPARPLERDDQAARHGGSLDLRHHAHGLVRHRHQSIGRGTARLRLQQHLGDDPCRMLGRLLAASRARVATDALVVELRRSKARIT
jgi:hypothetical protein